MVHYQLMICDYIMVSVLQTGYAAPLSVTRGQEVTPDCYLHTLAVLWAFAGELWKVSNSGNDAVVSHEGQG